MVVTVSLKKTAPSAINRSDETLRRVCGADVNGWGFH